MDRTQMTTIRARLLATSAELLATHERIEEQQARARTLHRQAALSRRTAVETRQRTQQIRQNRHSALTLQAAPAPRPVPAAADTGRPYSRQLCPRHGNVSLNRHGICPNCFCAEQARGALAGNARLIADRSAH